MSKKRQIIIVCMLAVLILFAIFALSAAVGITITKPLNQSYNANTTLFTVNATTSASAGICKYMLNYAEQGMNWTRLNSSAAFSARYGHTSVATADGKIWLIGGFNDSYLNDVWYTTDGANWTQANASAAFDGRYLHSSVATPDGKIWITGGINNTPSYTNDVWNSTDGANWSLVNGSAAFPARHGHASVVTSDGTMWVIGGYNNSGARMNDVWNSTDGINWKLVNSSAAFEARYLHTAIADSNDKIWIMGGNNGSYLNDVWSSTDGANWVRVDASAEWAIRNAHASVYTADDGKMWVIGGYNSSGYLRDVWYSADGANWTMAAGLAGWAAREFFPAVIGLNSSIVVMGGITTGGYLNDVWHSLPYINMSGSGTTWGKEFTPQQGGNIIYVKCSSLPNGALEWNTTNVSFSFDSILPVLTITSPANMTYNNTASRAVNVTLSETASACLYSLNGAANVTMDGSTTTWGKEFTAAEGGNTIAVSCNDTVDNWNSTSIAFFMDSIKPVLNISFPLNETYTYTNFTVNVTTNESSSICYYALNSHGIDENWTLLNASAAFDARYGHSSVNTSDGNVWVIGGRNVTSLPLPENMRNDTWRSTDGINWIPGNYSANFEPRYMHTSVLTSDERMWVIAGYDAGTPEWFNDISYSADGANWTEANSSAAFSGRYGHSSVLTSDGRMWVIGGLEQGGKFDTRLNDVWHSADGANWTQANASAAFSARDSHSSAVGSDGKMWVIGGYDGSSALNDVWYSTDGANWTQANSSAAFSARYGQASFATSDGRIWVIGGYDGANYYSDVWYSTNGANWLQTNSSALPWPARYGHTSLSAYGNKLLVIGGVNISGVQGTVMNDVWSTPIPAAYYPMDGSSAEWGKNFTASQGNNDVKVRCYDSAGNLNSSIVWFYVDSVKPIINITRPFNQSYTTSSLTINATTNEAASACLYSLNGAANATMDGSSAEWGKAFTATFGANTIVVSCNDTLNNWNSTSIAFSASFAYCGDGACNGAETTSSCSADCPAAAETTSGGGGAAEKAQANFYNLEPNVPVEKKLDEKGIALTKVVLTAEKGAKDVKMSIEKKQELPESVKEPEGEVYQLLEIKIEAEEEVKAEICFSVEQEWLEEKEAKKEDVALAHYSPRPAYKLQPVQMVQGKELRVSFSAEQKDWEELPTKIVKAVKEAERTEYCAETKEFSTYAIVAREKEMQEFLTVIQPVVKKQILEPRKEPAPAKAIDLWSMRIPITAIIDIILIISLVSVIVYGRRFAYFMPEAVEEPVLPPAAPKKEFKASDSSMIKFTKKNLLLGYPESDIISSMAAKNISEDTIRDAVKKAYRSICEMSESELVPHVTDLVMRGYSEPEIKGMLMKNGVSAGCVYSAIKAARGHISKMPPAAIIPFVQKCISSGIGSERIKKMLMRHGIREKKAASFIRKAHSAKKRNIKH